MARLLARGQAGGRQCRRRYGATLDGLLSVVVSGGGKGAGLAIYATKPPTLWVTINHTADLPRRGRGLPRRLWPAAAHRARHRVPEVPGVRCGQAYVLGVGGTLWMGLGFETMRTGGGQCPLLTQTLSTHPPTQPTP